MFDNRSEAAENHVTNTKAEDGKLYIQTTYYDDEALARNDRIRNSGILDKAKLELHQNEDIRGVISCPSVDQWNQFNSQHPEVKELLDSPYEHERLKALDVISLHKPAWVLMQRM